ncbi:hypothetical protein [Botrimarina hoheduenensis]|uniref:Uncharacterized protein n=1 Tax=Botrimarina hoheduenensis TaxID=2528000 RepID=A0A5C5WCJ6_9BACT|nr:hypothetical protein [Botrimarina hoheduenensis]TWT47795.1 hypothetical protein Pla111_14180 [Botrimarina hoheduenensis]
MSESTEAPWRSDWSLFIDELADCLRASEDTDGLARRFGNQSVEWEGVLDRKQIDELAPSVNLALPEKHIDFGDGRVAMLKSVSLPLADSAIAGWQQIAEGTMVKFSAMVGAGVSPFPPVEVTNLRSGKTIVMIRLSEGAIVRINK